MTDVATNPAHQHGASTSRSLPPLTTTSAHSAGSLHAMSTRSSDALSRRLSVAQQQQPPTTASSGPILPVQHPSEVHRLPTAEARLTRKRARSINVDEANHYRVDELNLQSPAVGSNTPSSASTISNSDLICICPSPPKVPRPRNGTSSRSIS